MSTIETYGMTIFGSSAVCCVKIVIVLFTFLFSTVSFGEIGFHPLDSMGVPKAVKKAGVKVLKIWTPFGTDFIPFEQLGPLRAQLRASNVDERTQVINHFNSPKVNRCIRYRVNPCPLWKTAGGGSAFVVNGNKLVTAYHNFSIGQYGIDERLNSLSREWKKRIENGESRKSVLNEIDEFKANPLMGAPFLLKDHNGNIIHDSASDLSKFLLFNGVDKPLGTVDLAILGQDGAVDVTEPNFSFDKMHASRILDDVAIIKLSKNIPSIEVSPGACTVGEKIYIVGFPSSTENRTQYNARNAVSGELSVSTGKTISTMEAQERGVQWSQIEKFISQFDGEPAWFSDADSTPGLSGGVVLNESGKVCGVLNGVLPMSEDFKYDPDNRRYFMFSYGRKVTDLMHLLQSDEAGKATIGASTSSTY